MIKIVAAKFLFDLMQIDRLKIIKSAFVTNLNDYRCTSKMGMNRWEGSMISDSRILSGGASMLIF